MIPIMKLRLGTAFLCVRADSFKWYCLLTTIRSLLLFHRFYYILYFDLQWCQILFILILIIAFLSLMDKKGIRGRSYGCDCSPWAVATPTPTPTATRICSEEASSEGGIWTASTSFSSCYAKTSSDRCWWWGASNQEATSGLTEEASTEEASTEEAT